MGRTKMGKMVSTKMVLCLLVLVAAAAASPVRTGSLLQQAAALERSSAFEESPLTSDDKAKLEMLHINMQHIEVDEQRAEAQAEQAKQTIALAKTKMQNEEAQYQQNKDTLCRTACTEVLDLAKKAADHNIQLADRANEQEIARAKAIIARENAKIAWENAGLYEKLSQFFPGEKKPTIEEPTIEEPTIDLTKESMLTGNDFIYEDGPTGKAIVQKVLEVCKWKKQAP